MRPGPRTERPNDASDTNQHELGAGAIRGIRVIRLFGPCPGAATLIVAYFGLGSHVLHVTPDPHAALRESVLQSVLASRGETDPALRRAAADGRGVPSDLQALVDKVHRHAYKVTDDDLAHLQGKYSDDQLFEIVVSAALGASRNRLRAGLEALDNA